MRWCAAGCRADEANDTRPRHASHAEITSARKTTNAARDGVARRHSRGIGFRVADGSPNDECRMKNGESGRSNYFEKGLKTGTPIPAMSETFRVTSVIPWTSAVAASRASTAGLLRPSRSASPHSFPHASETDLSTGRMRFSKAARMSFSNHFSRATRRGVSPSLTRPFSISPIVTNER